MAISRANFLSILISSKFLGCSAFSVSPQKSTPLSYRGSTVLQVQSKYFQLEEMEDKETCTTEVFLSKDGTVSLGGTDGPLFIASDGTWEQDPNGFFTMTVKRTFESGNPGTEQSDLGEFQFDVERTYNGEIDFSGNAVLITGSIISIDDILGDRTVGYFSMIDTTDTRLGEM